MLCKSRSGLSFSYLSSPSPKAMTLTSSGKPIGSSISGLNMPEFPNSIHFCNSGEYLQGLEKISGPICPIHVCTTESVMPFANRPALTLLARSTASPNRHDTLVWLWSTKSPRSLQCRRPQPLSCGSSLYLKPYCHMAVLIMSA